MPKVTLINLSEAIKQNPSMADIVAQQLNEWLDECADDQGDLDAEFDWEERMAEWEHDDV